MDLSKLHEIDEELTTSEVAALKFLCMDHLGRKRLETMKDAKDLFLRLSEQALLQDKFFLSDLLYTIGRYDLLSILGTKSMEVSMLLRQQSSGVSVYRKFLYKLSEDITGENLDKIKFLLSSLPKAKLASATFLDVLAEMEKMERLGEDNLLELEDVLSKCNRELAFKVQKFKERHHISISAQEESISLPVPQQEESISLPVSHQEESISLPVSHQEESISLPVSHQEESISLPVPHQVESISLPVPHQVESTGLLNLSIAETHTPILTVTGTLSETIVDTDAQGEPVSDIAPMNAINADDSYPMTRRPLGHCLIINNYNFEERSTLTNRKGTDADKDALTEVFSRMHFMIEARTDLLSSDMLDTVKEFSEMDHSEMDAFVCCILSHGQKSTVLGIDGKPVQIRDLTQPFALCSTLTGKPKLFFIQACQGNELQDGMWRPDGNEEDKYEEDAKNADLRRVPIEADFLIGMATVESYKSFRHTIEGSIYIQELCKHLMQCCPSKEDILSILTKVNRSVSDKELNRHKQMPEPRYTLTKKLVLPME